MNPQDRNTGIYLVGIIIMFGILVVIAGQFITPLFQRNRESNISVSLAKPIITIDTSRTFLAKLTTNKGEVEILLCASCAPKNVNNFIYLSNNSYYNGTKFHRVVKDLLIQGGDRNTISTDITSYGKGKTSYLIEDEVNWDSLGLSEDKRNYLSNNGYKNTGDLNSKPIKKYSIAMANDGPNTNSSQFFIVTAENTDSRLEDFNGLFTVIGEVTSGFSTLDSINAAEVIDNNNFLPKNDIVIEKIEIIQK